MANWLREILSKPTTTVPLAGEAIGLSRNSSYEAAQRGEIPTLQFGRRKVVPTAWLRQILQLPTPSDD
jgi:hypothetical protein